MIAVDGASSEVLFEERCISQGKASRKRHEKNLAPYSSANCALNGYWRNEFIFLIGYYRGGRDIVLPSYKAANFSTIPNSH